MNQEQIDRINELARKSKVTELTKEEKEAVSYTHLSADFSCYGKNGKILSYAFPGIWSAE